MIESRTKLKRLPEHRIKKSKKIAVMNNKGGCGKTTTAISLGLHLARSGYNVLMWDSDPQSNLTQRLGISDEKFKGSRLNFFFRNADLENTDEELNKFGIVVRYPYFYRMPDSDIAPGDISIMPGSHMAEMEAESAVRRLKENRFYDPGKKDIFQFFRYGIQFYSNYFDYIIIDTAPAMEGNVLCQLAVRTADEIICPVDGVEAASGVKQLIQWLYNELTSDPSANIHLPNMLFAMMKYQDDTKNVADQENDLHYGAFFINSQPSAVIPFYR
jgi:cellulose biosynthesis protein BcsQ